MAFDFVHLIPTFKLLDISQTLAQLPLAEQPRSDSKGPYGISALAKEYLNTFNAMLQLYDLCFIMAYPQGNKKLKKLSLEKHKARLNLNQDTYLKIKQAIDEVVHSEEELKNIVLETTRCEESIFWHENEAKHWKETRSWEQFIASLADEPSKEVWNRRREAWLNKIGKFAHYPSQAILRCAHILENVEQFLLTTEKTIKFYQTASKTILYLDNTLKLQIQEYISHTRNTITEERVKLCSVMLDRLHLASDKHDIEEDDVLFSLAEQTSRKTAPHFHFKGLSAEAFGFFYQFLVQYGSENQLLHHLSWHNEGIIRFQIASILKGKQLILVPQGAPAEDLEKILKNEIYRGPKIHEVVCWNHFLVAYESISDNIKLLQAFLAISKGTCENFKSLCERESSAKFFLHWREALKRHILKVMEFAFKILTEVRQDLGLDIANAKKNPWKAPKIDSKVIKEVIKWVYKIQPFGAHLDKQIFHKLLESAKAIEENIAEVLFHHLMHLDSIQNQMISPKTGLPLVEYKKDEFQFACEILQGFPITARIKAAQLLADLVNEGSQAKSLEEIEAAIKVLNFDIKLFLRPLLLAIADSKDSFAGHLLELIEAFDKKYLVKDMPNIKTAWYQKRKASVEASLQSLLKYIVNPFDNSLEEDSLRMYLEGILACTFITPALYGLLKNELMTALDKYDGSHNKLGWVVSRLQDIEITNVYGSKRLLHLFPNQSKKLLEDKELLEMIFCSKFLSEVIYKRIEKYFSDSAFSLYSQPLKLHMLDELLSDADVDKIYTMLDELYLNKLKEFGNNEREELFFDLASLQYPEFPRTSKIRKEVEEYFSIKMQKEWTPSLHKLIERFSSHRCIQASKVIWLEKAFNKQEHLEHAETIHFLFYGTGFAELCNFFGEENLDTIFNITKDFLNSSSNNIILFNILHNYYFKSIMPEGLSWEAQGLFQRYDALCDRIQELSRTHESVRYFRRFLEKGNYQEALEAYHSLLMKKEISSDLSCIFMGLSYLENITVEWIKDSLARTEQEPEVKKQIALFYQQFLEPLKDNRLKKMSEKILDKVNELTQCYNNLFASFQSAYFEKNSWLFILEEQVLDTVLHYYSQSAKYSLSEFLGTLSPIRMDMHTKEATLAFKRLLCGKSKDASKDRAFILLVSKYAKYLEKYVKLQNENEILALFETIKKENPAIASTIILWLKNPINFSQIPLEKSLREWQSMLLTFLIGPGHLGVEQCINSSSYGYRRINPDYEKLIFDPNGDLKFKKGHNRHPGDFISIAGKRFHLKFFPDAPGIQYATNSFERLVGNQLVPYVELLRFPAGKAKQSRPYCTMASQEIVGITLREYWEKKLSLKINLESFSEKLVSSSLLVYQDEKPENLIITPNGEIANIDGDQALGHSVAINGNKKDLLYFSGLCCFDEMFLPIAPPVIERYARLSIYQVLKNWSLELKHYNDRFSEMFTPSDCAYLFTLQRDNPMVIPIPLRKELITEMWSKLTIVQNLFRAKPKCTHFDLFEALHPDAAVFYKKAFQEHNSPYSRLSSLAQRSYNKIKDQASPIEFFETLSSSADVMKSMYGKIPNVEDIAKERSIEAGLALEKLEELHGEKDLQEVARVQLKSGNLLPFIQLGFGEAKEEVINGTEGSLFDRVILSELPEPLQKETFQAMCGVSWKKLFLSDCSSLDDKLLEDLLKKSPKLFYLSICGCTKLTAKTLENLQQYCPDLHKLDVSGLNFIKFEFAKSKMKKLKHLILNDCKGLKEINLKCRQLSLLSIKNCPIEKLEVYTRNPEIKVLSIRKFWRGLVLRKNTLTTLPWTLVCNEGHEKIKSMLHTIVEMGLLNELKKFQARKVNYDTRNSAGLTPLHIALLSDHKDKYEIIHFLMTHGASPNVQVSSENKQYSRMNAVHLAVEKDDDNPQLWELLQRSLADFNCLDRQNLTPLYHACIKGKVSLIKTLLDIAKVDVRAASPKGLTALHIAAGKGHEDVVRYLISRGAIVDAQDSFGSTPFDSACLVNFTSIAEILRESGANINHKKLDGTTILHQIVSEGIEPVVDYLISRNIQLDIQSADGKTALHIACEKGHKEIVRKLLKAGANSTLRDIPGKLAYGIAQAKGFEEILALFNQT